MVRLVIICLLAFVCCGYGAVSWLAYFDADDLEISDYHTASNTYVSGVRQIFTSDDSHVLANVAWYWDADVVGYPDWLDAQYVAGAGPDGGGAVYFDGTGHWIFGTLGGSVYDESGKTGWQDRKRFYIDMWFKLEPFDAANDGSYDQQSLFYCLGFGELRLNSDLASGVWYPVDGSANMTVQGFNTNGWNHLVLWADYDEGTYGAIVNDGDAVEKSFAADKTGPTADGFLTIGSKQRGRPIKGYLGDIALNPTGQVECGDWGYYPGDLNTDCEVNFEDLSLFVKDWLKSQY